jgi:serine protease Do
MPVPTRLFPAAFLAACSLALVAAPGGAAEKSRKAAWDPSRVTSPDNIDELRALQDRVKIVTQKVMPTTVGLLVGPAAGSGVIVSDDGLVLTAAHVIGKPGAKLTVILSDGSRVAGKALGVDPKTDSGMVRITGKMPESFDFPGKTPGKWPVAEIGSSAGLKKNQWVISLGHHGGPRTERTPPLRVGRYDYYSKDEQIIKTDCVLVGGDSGGPLFDLTGKLVGIHSKIGIFLEYNMHVPIDAFRDEWDELAAGDVIGKARVELGIILDPDADAPTVQTVTEDTPAAKAEVAPGDVIVGLDRERIKNTNDLKAARTDGDAETGPRRRGRHRQGDLPRRWPQPP